MIAAKLGQSSPGSSVDGDRRMGVAQPMDRCSAINTGVLGRVLDQRIDELIQVSIHHARTSRHAAEMKHKIAKAIARCGNDTGHTQETATKTIVSKPSAMPAR